jgi:serine/threonine-protein kinase/endoribonuclease IRE1
MFSCGVLLHYILSVKKHPFSPADLTSKGELQIAHETEGNIMNGKMEGWDNFLPPEATHLLKKMLESDESKRPSAGEALDHPFFWRNKKKIDFLIAVSNQPLDLIKKDLENSFRTIIKYGSWNDTRYREFGRLYQVMTTNKEGEVVMEYNTRSVVSLIRFIRNAYGHASENKLSRTFLRMLFVNYQFLDNDFPNLVMEVHKTVTTHGWDHKKPEIKCKMNEVTTF